MATNQDTRAQQLATATPEDHKPKWYHYLFLAAAAALFVWSFFDNPDNHLRAISALPLLALGGCCWWNYHVNGHIFDDRAGGH